MASILILDDDPGTARLQARCLERAGNQVAVVHHSEEAFRALSDNPADLLVVDYRLPGEVTGLGFVAHLRAAGFDVPVILVSGDRDERPIIQALRMGVNDFIVKDAAFLDQLPAAATRVLERVKLESQLTGANWGRADIQWNLILIIEDDEGAAKQQARHLKRAGYAVEIAPDLDSVLPVLQTKSVALILLDQRLALGQTGLGLYQVLRSSGYDIPAILVTGFSDSATAAQALRAGVRDYIEKKPGYEQELSPTIERVLERVRLEREIADSNTRLACLISSANDAILAVDERGLITLFNRAANDVFGVGTSEAVGRSIEQFLPDLFEISPQGRLTAPRSLRREIQGHRGDGGAFPLEVTIAQATVSGRTLYTVIARDMTDHKAAESNLRAANAALARANDDLQQFAYISSHDLQEPLRVITIFTQKLEASLSERLKPEHKEYMDYIVSSAHRMRALVTDALQYAQLSTYDPQPSTTPLNEVFEAAVGDCEPVIHDTGALVTHDPLPVVRAQRSHLQAVLRNLISNAIKYRGNRSPRIHASAELRDGYWELQVQDNGIGFEPQYSEQIFRVFKRLHGQEIPGTGIGLALCKRIIENHGGRIWANSKPGEGSTFLFTIPAA
jgi:PAS domain S-box-containing protein